MSLPSATQLHYRCTFDLKPVPGVVASWADILKSIRSWMAEKLATNEAYGGRWFFAGGEWKPPGQPRVVVKTERVRGTGTDDVPEFWSIRYEHPCSDVGPRQWRTDIGITSVAGGCYRFSLANTHCLLQEFIGKEPPVPLLSAPKIIAYTVNSKLWRAYSGSEHLRSKSVLLDVGRGNEFCERTKDESRGCPLVLVTREFETDKCLINAHRLAHLLAGNATVYEATSKDVNEELEWLLPKVFRCWNGMVRVYQPQADLESEYDARRHRFFGRAIIADMGARTVEDMIINGIARRSRTLVSEAVTTLEDLATRRREARLAELRATAADTSKDEWISLLEQDNKELEERSCKLKEDIEQLKTELELVEATSVETADQLATVNYQFNQQRQCAIDAESRTRVLEEKVACINSFVTLPVNLSEIIERIGQLHADKILFTDQAKQKAPKAAVYSQRSDMFHIWQCIWHVATTLHSLYFDTEQKSANIEQTFKDRTGYDLSLREGEATRADPKLMKLRRVKHEGAEIDIEPHVKWDGPSNRCFRLHYCAHRDEGRIIVGHCGDHLKTAGSRRRKER